MPRRCAVPDEEAVADADGLAVMVVSPGSSVVGAKAYAQGRTVTSIGHWVHIVKGNEEQGRRQGHRPPGAPLQDPATAPKAEEKKRVRAARWTDGRRRYRNIGPAGKACNHGASVDHQDSIAEDGWPRNSTEFSRNPFVISNTCIPLPSQSAREITTENPLPSYPCQASGDGRRRWIRA
jgi:hypothetical protein